jgi:hypothetical protein
MLVVEVRLLATVGKVSALARRTATVPGIWRQISAEAWTHLGDICEQSLAVLERLPSAWSSSQPTQPELNALLCVSAQMSVSVSPTLSGALSENSMPRTMRREFSEGRASRGKMSASEWGLATASTEGKLSSMTAVIVPARGDVLVTGLGAALGAALGAIWGRVLGAIWGDLGFSLDISAAFSKVVLGASALSCENLHFLP